VKPVAARKNAFGLFALAYMYNNGTSVLKQDTQLAYKLYEESAALGCLFAFCNLGLIHQVFGFGLFVLFFSRVFFCLFGSFWFTRTCGFQDMGKRSRKDAALALSFYKKAGDVQVVGCFVFRVPTVVSMQPMAATLWPCTTWRCALTEGLAQSAIQLWSKSFTRWPPGADT
jgi:hypothetical protein